MTAAAVPSAAAGAAAARLLLRGGRSVETRIRGGSMQPGLRDGDGIRIESVAVATLRRGDVIAFLRREEIVAHRLVHRLGTPLRRELLLTAGDGNWFPDTAIEPDAVLGRIAAIDTGAGWTTVPAASERAWPRRLVAWLAGWIAVATLTLHGRLRRHAR